MRSESPATTLPVSGGWLQVNNIVIPYVDRNGMMFVPSKILHYGGRLLSRVKLIKNEVEALAEEVGYLKRILKAGGFNYPLQPSEYKLISITLAWSLCEEKPSIRELPEGDDPMVHASFDDSEIIEINSSASSADSDVEIISDDIEVRPTLVAVIDNIGEDEIISGAQGSKKTENSECDIGCMVALQTPAAALASSNTETVAL